MKKKTIIISASVITALCIIASVVCILFFNNQASNDSKFDCKVAYEQYTNVKDTLNAVEAYFANDDGNIDHSKVNETIISMTSKLDVLKEKGTINKYEKNDTGVFIELASGIGYLYSLNIKDMMPGDELGKIVTIEPYAYNKELVAHYLLGGRSPDKSAEKIASALPDDYQYDNGNVEYNLDSFEADDIDKLMNNKIVIWYGHGGYTSETGPCLGTSAPITDQYTILKYNQELANKEIILGSENFCITPAFLDKHLGENSMKGSIVYLGACETGRDNRLAEVFLNKGAKTVLGNSKSIFTRYNLYMLTDFFEGLTKTSDNGEMFTANQALSYAKKENGEKDGEFFFLGAEVVIFGDKNIRLSSNNSRTTEKPTEKSTENPTETKTYTAVELAGKSLDEIKSIMGGNYKSEHIQLSNAFSSDGTSYVYNYDVLPGFAFETYDNDYRGISIMDGAKLNDQISSDMTYNQIADIIGEMDGNLVGQDYNIACSKVVDGYNICFCFIENDYIRNNKTSGGIISSNLLKGGNPKLQSIGLIKGSEESTKSVEGNTSNDSIILEDLLGAPESRLIELFGDDSYSVSIPGSGLPKCLTYNSLSNVAFGFSQTADEVVLVDVIDCEQTVRFTKDITSDMTGRQLLSLSGKYSISEAYNEAFESYTVVVKDNNGQVIVFGWNDSDYMDKIPNFVDMQKIPS